MRIAADSYLISKDFYITRKNAHCHCSSYLISKDFNIKRKNVHCCWWFLLDIQGVSGLLAWGSGFEHEIISESVLFTKEASERKNAHCRWFLLDIQGLLYNKKKCAFPLLFLLDIQGVCGLLAQLGVAGVHQLGEHSGQGAQVIEHLRKKS